MQENELTDEGFGERIGRSRMQVFRYRHGEDVPSKKTMERILQVTEGQVQPGSFYQVSQQGP